MAELQVTGVKTTFSKHPHSMSLTLCVHSLLLVDALQTFGPDFELLLASHKHLRYIYLISIVYMMKVNIIYLYA